MPLLPELVTLFVQFLQRFRAYGAGLTQTDFSHNRQLLRI